MWSVEIDVKKAQAIPASLNEWASRAHKGPRTLVAELCRGGATAGEAKQASTPCCSLKEWTSELGPRAMVAQLVG